jgi:hypothetical protein
MINEKFEIFSYYRCFRSKQTIKCPGKIMIENGKTKTIHQHNHEKETKITVVDKFRKILTKKAVEKPKKSLLDIYLEETLNFTEASILYPFDKAESTMRKARAKHNKEKGKTGIESTRTKEKTQSNQDQLHKHYLHEILHNGTSVMFIHQYSMKLLGKIDEIHVDCSITCKDENEQEFHLITVIAIVRDQDFPIAFGFVKLKNLETFSTFFIHIRERSQNTLLPNNILTNCDVNLHESFRIAFPDATIKILWFFYASSVLYFAKEQGMLTSMNKSLFHLSSLKMILSIPLIPANYITPALDAIKKWMFEKSVNSFNGLCEFVDASWLFGDGAEKLSIFNGLSHSINNYIQTFQRDLLRSCNDITSKDEILQAISKQAPKLSSKLNKSGITLKKSQRLQKTILETATHNWIKANIHLRRPIQFLQQVSHCIDDSLMNYVLNYDLHEKNETTLIIVPPSPSFSDCSSVASPAPPQISSLNEGPPPLIYYKSQPSTSSQSDLLMKNTNSLSEPPPLAPISFIRSNSNQ